MVATITSIKTEHGSKYLQQLCKHFAHKVTADYDAEKGHVEFPMGPCSMTVEEGAIIILCQSDQDEGVKMMQSVIESHLVKFAWREEVVFDWKEADGGGDD